MRPTPAVWSAVLLVFQIEVVDDLGDGLQSGVAQTESLGEHLKGAAAVLMGELGSGHVEPNLACCRAVAAPGHELESRRRIDEALDQPGAGNAIHHDPGSRHPQGCLRSVECLRRSLAGLLNPLDE